MQEVWQNKKLAETRAELLCSPHSTPMHRDSPPPLTSQPVLRSRRSQSLNASHGYVHVQGGHLATVVDIVTRRAPASSRLYFENQILPSTLQRSMVRPDSQSDGPEHASTIL